MGILPMPPGKITKGAIRYRGEELLDQVGTPRARQRARRYPHEFSGGMRQHAMNAMSLALDPDVLIADESTTALDVEQPFEINPAVAPTGERHLHRPRPVVMYLGKVVEIGTEDEIYTRPSHPYTQALLSAVPVPDPAVRVGRKRIRLTGDVPSPVNPPTGCRFRTRCWKATDLCADEEPALEVRSGGHPSACHHAEEQYLLPT